MKTFGFPRMFFEENEKRDFLPGFFRQIGRFNLAIKLEHGYGARLGYSEQDYLAQNPAIEFVSRSEVFACNVVVIIRTPAVGDLKQMRKGSSLFSMIHFVTHKKRCDLLSKLGVNMFAMDSVVDDHDRRMIEYIRGTVENGIHAAIDQFFENSPGEKKIKFTIIGSGRVGKAAVDFALHSSNKPCICHVIGRNVTSDINLVNELMPDTDILIDTTHRIDTSKVIIPNHAIGLLPPSAVILDLTADEYDENVIPMQQKAIEGIPTGNLDQYIFKPDDRAFDSIPKDVGSDNRRTTVSCYSWPAIDARKCLEVYQKQLLPFIHVLADTEPDDIVPDPEDFYKSALARGRYRTVTKTLNVA